MIIENFLPDFDAFRRHAVTRDYSGIRSSVDDVVYPDISLDIPRRVRHDIEWRVRKALGAYPAINHMFLRLTTRNTNGAPHQAHTDSSMGAKSLMLYLQDGEGGTSFVQHTETGMWCDPRTPEEFAAWQRDTNRPEAWRIYDMCPMKANRACIFDAGLMHMALPVGGFGTCARDGRLVLTAFFD